MCGIAGYIQRAPSNPAVIEAMLRQITHRGPDAAGIWRQRCPGDQWETVLGHRRLSILDIEGSPQPMADCEGVAHLTYNGEIYNFNQLRGDLRSAGQSFRSAGDTEVVLHHLRRRGEAGLADLNGMFAFGLWDSARQSLLLARDRSGIKPLYWATLPCGGIVFASELIALAMHPQVNRDICPAALAEFFSRDYVLPPRTMLKGVSKLLPGQWLRWDAATATISTGIYWKPAPSTVPAAANADRLGELLLTAVQSQLMADVPLGVFLSGGIDSSLIAALATKAAQKPLSTFSIGFDDASFDESSCAELVARQIGSTHFHRRITDSVMIDSLDDALAVLDEPMGDHSIVPTCLLSKLAAKHVKVALGGDGADELFGGYPTYLAHRMAGLYAAVPAVARRRLIEPAIRAMPQSDRYQALGWKMKRFALRWNDSPLARHERWMSATDWPNVDRLFGEVHVPAAIDESGNDLNAILRHDFSTYLPGSVLTKVDRASMAHGLEVRPPFLDNGVIDFAMALPASTKVHGKTTKWILKRLARKYLPAEIVYRKKKGFSVPLARWIRGPLRERAAEAIEAGSNHFDCTVARSFLDEHVAGKQDHSKTLWSMIVYRAWQRRLDACHSSAEIRT